MPESAEDILYAMAQNDNARVAAASAIHNRVPDPGPNQKKKKEPDPINHKQAVVIAAKLKAGVKVKPVERRQLTNYRARHVDTGYASDPIRFNKAVDTQAKKLTSQRAVEHRAAQAETQRIAKLQKKNTDATRANAQRAVQLGQSIPGDPTGTLAEQMVKQLGLKYEETIGKFVTDKSVFYDASRSSINPLNGQKYTYDQFLENGGTAGGWGFDPNTLVSPLFVERNPSPRGPNEFTPDVEYGAPQQEIPGESNLTYMQFLRRLSDWAVNNPGALSAWQQQLYKAGWYEYVSENGGEYTIPTDPTSDKVVLKPRYGQLDRDTLEASLEFISYAIVEGNMQNKDFAQLLLEDGNYRATQFGYDPATWDGGFTPDKSGGRGGGGGGGAADVIQLSDPEAIRQTADQLAQQRIGRRLTPQEQGQVIDQFRAMETQEGQAKLAGGTVTSFDATAQINRMITELTGGETGAHDIAGMFNSFASIITQNFGGLGSSAPTFGQSNVGPRTGAGV